MKRLAKNILIGLLLLGLIIGISLLLLIPLPDSFSPGYQPNWWIQLYLLIGAGSTTLGMSYFCASLVKPETKWLALSDGMIWLMVYVAFGLGVGVFNNDLSVIFGALSSWFVMIALFCGPWLYTKKHGL